MKPWPHQLELAEQGFDILAQNMLVYLACEERTGKTLSAILICEKANVKNILVITKKNALKGWHDTLKAYPHDKIYTVTNYHQAKKQNSKAFDLIILDEAHNYVSSFPKRSKTWKEVRALTRGKPIVYLSATPHAQGRQLLYNQLALSDWSPFSKWTTPYSWHRAFGIPDVVYLYGRSVETYKKVRDDDVKTYVDHLFITKTRKALDFTHEPIDKIHYIGLTPKVKEVYNILLKHKVIILNELDLICDTSIKLRTSLHMLEGGVAKIDTTYMVLGNTEKIDFIKKHWGDSPDIAIMYNYIAEKAKLERHFKQAKILQATSFAEGIDLSHIQHLVIYSQDFSTARHSQRRARQANKNRKHPIIVHYLLVQKAISEQVYKTVSVNKTNFVDSVFTRETL